MISNVIVVKGFYPADAPMLGQQLIRRQPVLAVVHQPDFASLVSKLDIDHAVTPRACIANRVLKLVNQEHVSSLVVLEEGQVEVVEISVNGSTNVLGKRLQDIRFPKHCLVACILRGEHVIVPTGEDEIHAGDSVVVIASGNSLDGIQKLFAS